MEGARPPCSPGGGIGGTGFSTGAIIAFGSVIVNDVEFQTDNAVSPTFVTRKFVNGVDDSSLSDRDAFRVGMIVTVHHDPDDANAVEIDYEDNLKGPIAAKTTGVENTLTVLDYVVVLDNATLFDSLLVGDVLEVSGFADNAGRIRATFVEVKQEAPSEYEIKGFVSGRLDNEFMLGLLPDGSGTTVTVDASGAELKDMPEGLQNGYYVEVKTDPPGLVNGRIQAKTIEKETARTDFPEGAAVSFEGLVTRLRSRSGQDVAFDLEGKEVRTSAQTFYAGGDESNIQPNARLEAEGTATGGVVSAARIVFR